METNVIIGLAVIAAMVLGGLVISRLLARVVYPTRERLFAEATELLRNGGLSLKEKGIVNRYMDMALSFTAGWIVPLALILAISDTVMRKPAPCASAPRKIPALLTARFAASVLAANPLALVFSLPLLALQTALAGLIEHESPREAARDVVARMPSAGHMLAA